MQTPMLDSPSLVTTAPGETVRVRRILFGAVRSLCQGQGLTEGAIVRRRGDIGDTVILETADGEPLTLDRRWARFVQVEPGHASDSTRSVQRSLRPKRDRKPARA